MIPDSRRSVLGLRVRQSAPLGLRRSPRCSRTATSFLKRGRRLRAAFSETLVGGGRVASERNERLRIRGAFRSPRHAIAPRVHPACPAVGESRSDRAARSGRAKDRQILRDGRTARRIRRLTRSSMARIHLVNPNTQSFGIASLRRAGCTRWRPRPAVAGAIRRSSTKPWIGRSRQDRPWRCGRDRHPHRKCASRS